MVSTRPTGKFIHGSQSGVPEGQTQTTFGFLPTQLTTSIIQAVGYLQERWVEASDELTELINQPQSYRGTAPTQEQKQNLEEEKITLGNQINVKLDQIIDQETEKMINDISNQRLIVPTWFSNNVNWVISGQITKTDFLAGLQNLLDEGTAYYGTAPIITEPPEPEITLPSIYGGQYVPGVEPTTVNVTPPEPEPEPITVTVTPGKLTWYHVKKPSGACEFLNVSEKFVNQMTSQGWIFSLNDICYEPPTPIPPTIPPTIPTPTPTPTEPGEVNWIPEPFFSFINNVFRK